MSKLNVYMEELPSAGDLRPVNLLGSMLTSSPGGSAVVGATAALSARRTSQADTAMGSRVRQPSGEDADNVDEPSVEDEDDSPSSNNHLDRQNTRRCKT